MQASDWGPLLKWRWNQTLCTLFGHAEATTIMYNGGMIRCCPRCGEEV